MHRHPPGGLGRLRVHEGRMQLEVLDDAGHHLEVSLEVDHPSVHALHHLHALHVGPATACLTRRPQIDLMLRALAAVDAHVDALVVQDAPPRFALTVVGRDGRRELALDPIDAAALIFARRVRLEVRGPVPDWDRELDELLGR